MFVIFRVIEPLFKSDMCEKFISCYYKSSVAQCRKLEKYLSNDSPFAQLLLASWCLSLSCIRAPCYHSGVLV